MSALLLKEDADYLVHDSYTVETEDHEDHTFNGVMFDVEVKFDRPVSCVIVDSVFVRGGLGEMSVWYAKGGFGGKEEDMDAWAPCYSRKHKPSWRDFDRLELDYPMVLEPGEVYGIYVHSAEYGDDGIVYDNQRSEICHEDDFIVVYPGLAHLAPRPFSGDGPWWGSPWRRRRTFVGKLSYGARYILWGPKSNAAFSGTFRNGCAAAFAALTMGWGGLPSDCVLYILHLARFDWYDTPESLAERAALEAPAAADDGGDGDDVDFRIKHDDDDDDFSDYDTSDDGDDDDGGGEVSISVATIQDRYTTDYARFDAIVDSDDEPDTPVGPGL